MTEKIIDNRNEKQMAIDLLDIAEKNLLLSIVGLKNEEVTKQIAPNINHILWIVGHLASHVDMVYCDSCMDNRIMNEDMTKYFAYGVSKEQVTEKPPVSFGELIEIYLKISKKVFEYLDQLPEEKYMYVPETSEGKEIKESIKNTLERVSLHMMGHIGQIYLIRRHIENPGKGFVAGIAKSGRQYILENWLKWWEENKKEYF
ncbi:MAG TPA: DinB family protein [Candidatus Bathyarchaeia archaeon]|nr:DinB family protein [Candidatus Bathyarchaeia archaeon]